MVAHARIPQGIGAEIGVDHGPVLRDGLIDIARGDVECPRPADQVVHRIQRVAEPRMVVARVGRYGKVERLTCRLADDADVIDMNVEGPGDDLLDEGNSDCLTGPGGQVGLPFRPVGHQRIARIRREHGRQHLVVGVPDLNPVFVVGILELVRMVPDTIGPPEGRTAVAGNGDVLIDRGSSGSGIGHGAEIPAVGKQWSVGTGGIEGPIVEHERAPSAVLERPSGKVARLESAVDDQLGPVARCGRWKCRSPPGPGDLAHLVASGR